MKARTNKRANKKEVLLLFVLIISTNTPFKSVF
jgi:hypothetical protein